jgi:peptidoglycan LD-endopeptidase CwlK
LTKLSRDRLQGVHPDLVRAVERAIQITTQNFRVQQGLRTRER